jgi:hypothetical protein
MLEALGNFGDFIGGLAVIATLVYLAVQIRQNSTLLRRAGAQSAAAGAAASIGLAAQSPENAAIYHKGLVHFDELSPEEQTHFFLLMASQFVEFSYGYAAHTDGAMSDYLWQIQWQSAQLYLATPGGRAWWERVGSRIFPLDSAFPKLIEAEIQKHG